METIEINTNISLLFDWILITTDQPVDKTESGLIIPEISQEKKSTGVVELVGNQVQGLKAGDRVAHIHFFGMKLIYKGMLAYLMREHDVIVVLE